MSRSIQNLLEQSHKACLAYVKSSLYQNNGITNGCATMCNQIHRCWPRCTTRCDIFDTAIIFPGTSFEIVYFQDVDKFGTHCC